MTRARLAVAASVVATAAHVYLWRPPAYVRGAVTLAVAIACWVAASLLARAAGARAVGIACVAVAVVAVAVPERTSTDLWAYAMYGRTVAVHDASPYRSPPAAFEGDPALARMTAWEDERSVYGPAWVLVSAGGMSVASSRLATRVFFQSLAALATLAACALVWRRTRDARAVALVGLHPVVAAHVINAGHTDALIGLAVLGGAIALERGRLEWGSVSLAAAALIKPVAAIAVAAAAVWAVRHRGPGAAVRALVPGSALFVGAYLAVGVSDAVGAFDATASIVQRHSVPAFVGAEGRTAVLVASALAALVGVALAARRPAPAGEAIGMSLAPLALAGAYVLPWYPAWSLGALAAARSRATAAVAAGMAALAAVHWPHRVEPYPPPIGDGFHPVATVAGPLLLAVALAGAVVAARRTSVTTRT